MAKRSYGQACGIARFLDLLGERWTLLVMREILFGEPRAEPKRFGELVERLPGVSRNLLASRLKRLQAAGVIQRVGAAVGERGTGWEATESGKELGPVLRAIGDWGLRHTDDPTCASR